VVDGVPEHPDSLVFVDAAFVSPWQTHHAEAEYRYFPIQPAEFTIFYGLTPNCIVLLPRGGRLTAGADDDKPVGLMVLPGNEGQVRVLFGSHFRGLPESALSEVFTVTFLKSLTKAVIAVKKFPA
jgi:hypothetical protein